MGCERRDLLASTSPPRQRIVLPTPVRTTEQYWALLLTTSFSRFSMNSLEVSDQVFGNVDKVSNLYPGIGRRCQLGAELSIDRSRLTPELHHLEGRPSPLSAVSLLSSRSYFVLVILFNEATRWSGYLVAIWS